MSYLKPTIALLVISIFLNTINAQNMQDGFNMLENGIVDKAEVFFKNILKDHPNNKTAKICYGRAVGLNGNPTKAQDMFKAMLSASPNDLEVKLNYYESLLWSKEFEKAEPLYVQLAEDYPDNFSALLGYSNTLSNLKKYDEALMWINKTIALQPDNNNAKVSRKYIKLGYASTYTKAMKYDEAEKMLLEIFEDFPDDKDTYLNLANLYLVSKETDKAISTYKNLAISKDDSIKSLAGISLVFHIDSKEKSALQYAIAAKALAKETESEKIIQLADERYTQALIWNGKFKKAEFQIDSLHTLYPKEKWFLALDATMGMYKSDFSRSINNYTELLSIDSASFDGNLGIANALYASGKVYQGYDAAFTTLDFYDKQKDALSFIDKLNSEYSPYITEKMAFTFDNGDNSAFWSNTSIYLPINEKLTTFTWYKYRKTKNRTTKYIAESNIIGVGSKYAFSHAVKLNAQIGVHIADADTLEYTQPTVDINLALKPYPLQDLSVGYKREIQNFNAELIAREIVMHHLGLTYNMGTNINLGWYTQMMYTTQTDDNVRKLLFTSVYYNLLKKPLLKTGINFQYMSFKDQVPIIYFSPSAYKALEWFIDSRGNLFKNTLYSINFAIGQQEVEEDPYTTLFRAQIGLTQNITPRLSFDLYGLYSNVASATAAGFEYVEYGFKIKWQLTKAPIFYNKLNK